MHAGSHDRDRRSVTLTIMAKLSYLAQSKFRGGILEEEMGVKSSCHICSSTVLVMKKADNQSSSQRNHAFASGPMNWIEIPNI